FDQNLRRARLTDWVRVHEGCAEQVGARWDQPIDLLFLDGDQSYPAARAAFLTWSAHLRAGGLLAVHNSLSTDEHHDGARRVVARVARGEFLLFLDGDDCMAPNLLDRAMALFRAEPDLAVVYGDVRQFQSRPGRASFLDWDTGPTDDLLADIHEMGIMTQSALLRRRVIDRVGPFQESLYVADYEFWLRAAWAGCRFRYCPGALAFYRSRPGQMSGDTPAMLRGIGDVWARALAYVDREPH